MSTWWWDPHSPRPEIATRRALFNCRADSSPAFIMISWHAGGRRRCTVSPLLTSSSSRRRPSSSCLLHTMSRCWSIGMPSMSRIAACRGKPHQRTSENQIACCWVAQQQYSCSSNAWNGSINSQAINTMIGKNQNTYPDSAGPHQEHSGFLQHS